MVAADISNDISLPREKLCNVASTITGPQRESKSAQGGSGKGKESDFKCSSLVGSKMISKDKMQNGIGLQVMSYEHQGAPIELMFSFVLEGP